MTGVTTESAWDWWERSQHPRTAGAKQEVLPFHTTGLAFLDAALTHTTRRMVEIYGAAGTGKTTTLLTVAARAVVSSPQRHVLYFGQEPPKCGDVIRLSTILQSLLWKESTEETHWETRFVDCLQRIHICTAPDDASGGWLPLLETLPQQLSSQDQSVLWLWDDWDRLSPREVRQVERVLRDDARIDGFLATATEKTRPLPQQQKVLLERVEAMSYRATVLPEDRDDTPQYFPYSISTTAGILL